MLIVGISTYEIVLFKKYNNFFKTVTNIAKNRIVTIIIISLIKFWELLMLRYVLNHYKLKKLLFKSKL